MLNQFGFFLQQHSLLYFFYLMIENIFFQNQVGVVQQHIFLLHLSQFLNAGFERILFIK